MPANDEEDEKETQPRDDETALSVELKKNKRGKEKSRGRFAPY